MYNDKNNDFDHDRYFDPGKFYVNYVTEDIEEKPQKKKGGGGRAFAFFLAMLLIGGSAGFGGSYLSNKYFPPESNTDSKAAASSNIVTTNNPASTSTVVNVIDKHEDGTYTIETVYDMVRPSIVDVSIYQTYRNQVELVGQGSGIIYSSDGYILSNAHVVNEASKISIRLSTGEEYDATVIGSDAATDVAVMKIDADNLPAATFGNSDNLRMGEAVCALGNPAGFSGTITNGIVSGLNQILDSTQVSNLECIQTTAAINPGVSGGALINMYGEVIGITSSKYVAEGYDNIGFAISINEALPIVKDLLEIGYVKRPILGVTCWQVSEYVAMLQGEIAGLHITEIRSDFPVANSGLRIGDVIVEINGKTVRSVADVTGIFSSERLKVGDIVTATVVRIDEIGREKTVEIDIELGEYTE